MLTCPFFAQAQFHIEKKVLYDPSTPNQYTASLEAFVTPKPVDIVLVVDVSKYSGTFTNNSKPNIIDGIKTFIDELNAEFHDKANTKIGIITYSDNASNLTEGLKSLSGGVDNLKAAAEGINIGSYKCIPSEGLSTAQGLFNRGDNHKKIIILIMNSATSDKISGYSSNQSLSSKQLNYLSNALGVAYSLKKEYDATIYTIAFGYTASSNSSVFFTGSSSGSGSKSITADKLFSRFSSLYPDTGHCSTSTSTWPPSFYTGTTGTTIDKNQTDGTFLFYASNGTTAEKKIQVEDRLKEIKESILTSIALDASKMGIKENIGDQLKVSDVSKIKLFKAQCNRVDYIDDRSTFYFNNPTQIDSPSPSFDVNTKTLAVNNYIFSEVYGTSNSGNGCKLIVQYPMIIASNANIPGTLTTGASDSGFVYDGDIVQALTPASVDVCQIQVTLSGLKKGESATFNVYKLDENNSRVSDSPIARLITTNQDDSGSASASCIVPEAGNYEVEESTWNWPYTPSPGRSIKQLVSGTSPVIFNFTNGQSATSPNHTENSAVIN